MKGELKSASTVNGVLCVMILGAVQMRLQCVDSQATQVKVSYKSIFNALVCDLSYCPLSIGAVAFSNAYFGAGMGTIHLDNVGCTGSETNLTDCPRSSTVSCMSGHTEDAGVRCQGKWFDALYAVYYQLFII